MTLVDSGPRRLAQGTTTVVDGAPAFYVAAEGDTFTGIATRFCLNKSPNAGGTMWLEWLNTIRRNGLFSSGGNQRATVHAGDTINLNQYTIATVGDEQGEVYDHEINFEIPPQR